MARADPLRGPGALQGVHLGMRKSKSIESVMMGMPLRLLPPAGIRRRIPLTRLSCGNRRISIGLARFRCPDATLRWDGRQKPEEKAVAPINPRPKCDPPQIVQLRSWASH